METSKRKNLNIILIQENSNIKKLSFNYNQTKEVRVGRSKDCEIRLNSNLLSRNQTTFYYDTKDEKWYVRDGYEKESSNGTWLLLDSEWKLSSKKDNLFRLGGNFLSARIVK